jgi:hypothetical protein
VSAEHGLGTDQQRYPAQHVTGQPVQQGREDGPIGGIEPHPVAAELTLQQHNESYSPAIAADCSGHTGHTRDDARVRAVTPAGAVREVQRLPGVDLPSGSGRTHA